MEQTADAKKKLDPETKRKIEKRIHKLEKTNYKKKEHTQGYMVKSIMKIIEDEDL